MTNSQIGFGIVGTGMIARVVADAIDKANNAKLVAISSRQLKTAQDFLATRQNGKAVQGIEALLSRPDVDAVYIATPTIAKEEIALAAIAAGKHILVDKPFLNHASLLRMTDAATAKGVVFMDATHFVHHPRTAQIKAETSKQIGSPRSLATIFYAPFSDHNNIRFDVKLEPMGAIGDMAWYSMRAIVEYLRPKGPITKVVTIPEWDHQTTAAKRGCGLIAFESGEVSTFDAGYTAGTNLMNFHLLGTTGVFDMDDFVLDWTNSFAFKDSAIETGYFYRTGKAMRTDVTFIPTPSPTPAAVLMIQDFAELMISGDGEKRAEYIAASLKTQEYVDAIWEAANTSG